MTPTLGMANAAYAIGTVFAVQFALRLPQRRMLLAYGLLLVAGSVLAASATAPGKTERLMSNVARANGFLGPRRLRAALEFGNA